MAGSRLTKLRVSYDGVDGQMDKVAGLVIIMMSSAEAATGTLSDGGDGQMDKVGGPAIVTMSGAEVGAGTKCCA